MIVIIPATFPNPLYCVPFYISPPIEGPILPIGPVLQSIRSETSAGGDVNLPVNIVDVAIACHCSDCTGNLNVRVGDTVTDSLLLCHCQWYHSGFN
jgi:hypothetical protein